MWGNSDNPQGWLPGKFCSIPTLEHFLMNRLQQPQSSGYKEHSRWPKHNITAHSKEGRHRKTQDRKLGLEEGELSWENQVTQDKGELQDSLAYSRTGSLVDLSAAFEIGWNLPNLLCLCFCFSNRNVCCLLLFCLFTIVFQEYIIYFPSSWGWKGRHFSPRRIISRVSTHTYFRLTRYWDLETLNRWCLDGIIRLNRCCIFGTWVMNWSQIYFACVIDVNVMSQMTDGGGQSTALPRSLHLISRNWILPYITRIMTVTYISKGCDFVKDI